MLEKLAVHVSYLLPKSWARTVRDYMVKGGVTGLSARQAIGMDILISAVFGFLSFSLAAAYFNNIAIAAAVGIISIVVLLFLFYFMLTSAAFTRGQQVENVLPDALRIISANMRAGMTLENAFWSAARPEFGPFKDEIGSVAADTLGGKSVEEALLAMLKRVESKILDRSMRLIVEGMRMGGRMTDLLEQVADDIEFNRNLQQQIVTTTTTYSIFILFAALVVSPLLFSVSTFYAHVSERTIAKAAFGAAIPAGAGASQAGGVQALALKPQVAIRYEDFRLFSLAVIGMTAFFSSILVWQIREGNPRRGLGYSPVFILIALAVYAVGLTLLEQSFVGLV